MSEKETKSEEKNFLFLFLRVGSTPFLVSASPTFFLLLDKQTLFSDEALPVISGLSIYPLHQHSLRLALKSANRLANILLQPLGTTLQQRPPHIWDSLFPNTGQAKLPQGKEKKREPTIDNVRLL